jgi:vanillate monooxygenase ferredoxin subunit
MNETALPLRVRVARKESVALDIVSFEFVHENGASLPPFSAGSHVDVAVGQGMTRQYSLCNDPRESHRYVIAVQRERDGRGGSRAMHDSVHIGDVIEISVPKNHFPLIESARASVLLAGGIGITPLLCMAERLCAIGHPFELHCSVRSGERAAFRERIERSKFARQVRFHYDDGPIEQRLCLFELLETPQPGVHVYTCGPKGFMDAVLAAAKQSGWPGDRVHSEYFGASPTKAATDQAFEVELGRSGRVIPVSPNQTVTEALAAHGVSVLTSCEQGVCGTCIVRVLCGEPDHRDMYLSEEERLGRDLFLPCCSRSRTARLVLDL